MAIDMSGFLDFLRAEIEKNDPADKSSSKFARDVGIGEDTISRLFRGDNSTYPRLETLRKIAIYTHNDISYLVRLLVPEATLPSVSARDYSERARFLAESYDKLPPEFRKILDASINAWISQNRKKGNNAP